MAGKPEIPVDQLTHYPLPFAPDPNLPPMPQPGENYDRSVSDFHHSVFERKAVGGFGIGGAAARDSRLQWTWRENHNRGHGTWGGLTVHMPDTPTKQFRTAAFGLIGYIPEQVISFDRPTPRVVTASRRQRELLRSGEQITLGNNGVRIRRFMLDHSFKAGAPAIDPGLVDQFLWLAARRNVSPRKQLALADMLMRQAIEPAVTPGLQEVYAYTKRREMLRPHLPKALGDLIRREIILGAAQPMRFIDLVLDKCVAFRTGALAT
ncbi:MAG: hypothetical protein ABWY71_00020 [Candidatus Saccharimonadales bacterium]